MSVFIIIIMMMAEKCFSNIFSFYYSTAQYKVYLCHLSLAAVLLSSLLFVTVSYNVLQAAHLALHIIFQASQVNIERKIFLCKRLESRKNILRLLTCLERSVKEVVMCR